MGTAAFNRKVQNASLEELEELKEWLIEENERLETSKKELETQLEHFHHEKKQHQTEVKLTNKRLQMEQKRLKQDDLFFEQKRAILERGFHQLDADKRKFEQEKRRFEAEKGQQHFGRHNSSSQRYADDGDDDRERSDVSAELFFNGVTNSLALRKRYKDLIKIFHPDNLCGDKQTVQMINEEYAQLRKEYEG